MLRRIYVWEFPVRLTHWVNVAAIVVLSFTGYYIGRPYAGTSGEAYGQTLMSTFRAVHMVAAFAFIASLLLRLYWAFVGNEYARFSGLFPFLNGEGRRRMVEAFRYYVFLRRRPPYVLGHNPLAGTTYMIIIGLYLVQVVTGFALYSQARPGSVWETLFNWLLLTFGGQTLRLAHRLIMYLLIAFAIHHVYSCYLMDAEEGNGLIASIFTGFKFVVLGEEKDQ